VNGVAISGFVSVGDQLNGLALNVGSSHYTFVNGMTVAFRNTALHTKGVQIGIINSSNQIHGVQIGLWNNIEFSDQPALQIGLWSRRITREHRLVYRYHEDAIQVISCRYHC
jgi:plasmid maintenance system killer protein